MKHFVKAVLMLSMLTMITSISHAYVIDGLVSDWGINLNNATNAGYLDTHLPNSSQNVQYVTEDNASSTQAWQPVGPGWTYGNTFDAEAMYFDNDANNLYLAIVQGMPKSGGTAPGNPWLLPGDIKITAKGADYGLNITDSHFYKVTSWKGCLDFTESNPWAINTTSHDYGLVDFMYSGDQNSHYVLEAKIPFEFLGISYGDLLNIHWTQECGNDALNLTAKVNTVPVPEPASMLLLGSGLLGLIGLRKRYL